MPEQKERKLTIHVVEGATSDDLRTVLADDRLQWAYASRMEDTSLGWLRDLLDGQPLGAPLNDDRPGVPLERWAEGRAFGPGLEVDWWHEGQTYRLRALLEEGDPPADVTWRSPSEVRLIAIGSKRRIPLHGTLDKKSPQERPTWSEARAPRHLAHPYEPEDDKPLPDKAALLGQDYGRDGIVVLTRLTGITSVEKQEEGEQ
jgi:hypothetical protein